MGIRSSRLMTAILVFAGILLTSGRSWAIYNVLGPSKNEWGLKYDVEINDVGGGKVNVVLIFADEGRLKPLDLIELFALNPQIDEQGGHSYDVKERITLKATKDGRLVGQVQMGKEFVDRAQIRIVTHTLDGRPQASGYACYEIPIKKFLNNGRPVAHRLAPPAASNVTK